MPQVLEYEPRPVERSTRLDDVAYLLPMGIFLALTWAGGKWQPFYTTSYVLKTLLAAAAIAVFWKRYTRIRWNGAWLGVAVGALGVVQWVGMEKLLLKVNYPHMSGEVFDPTKHFQNAGLMWTFIVIRWAGASLVVPFMEELFWRDYLWRSLLAPSDFKLAEVGERSWMAVVVVSLAFATVHIQWATAIVWGLMIAWLLLRTRSLGACIIAHGVTNFLLGGYVLWTKDWYYW